MLSPRTRLLLAWLCFGVHTIALAVMLFVLQFGLLLGDLNSHLAFIAQHTPAWQIGWFIWMPASLALVLLFLAWADALEFKTWGLVAVALCLGGAVIDWLDESIYIGVIPTLAARAPGDAFALYLFSLWEPTYRFVSIGLANGLYTAGGIILNALAFKTRGFPRWLARLGACTWGASLALSVFGVAGSPAGILVASAFTFAFFMPWTLLLGYAWLRQAGSP